MTPARPSGGDLPDGTRSLALLDSENLFHGIAALAPRAVCALEQWLAHQLPDPRATIEYGKIADPYVRAIQWRATQYHYRRVDVPNGKDEADDALIGDLTRWAPPGRPIMIGSGDRGLVCRAIEAVHGTASRVAWVVVGPRFPEADLADFDGPGLLGTIGRERVHRLDTIFQRHYGARLVADRDRRRRGAREDRQMPLWGPLPDLPTSLDWAALHPGPTSVRSPLFTRRASDVFAADGVPAALRGPLAELLATWLWHVMGTEHLAEDATPDRWLWLCLVAAAAPALAPGRRPSELAAALHLHVRGLGTEVARDALAQAERYVASHYGATRSEQLETAYGPFS